MIPLIAAFLVSIDPCEEIKIPNNAIQYDAKEDNRNFIVRLLSSIRIKEICAIPPKIQIKGGTDF